MPPFLAASRGLARPLIALPSLQKPRWERDSSVTTCPALPRRPSRAGGKLKRIGLAASSPLTSTPSSSSRLKASNKDEREEGAHSLPAYIHPPIPVEATVTHPHKSHALPKNDPAMRNAHRWVLFLIYAAAATALAAFSLPSTAASVSLLSTVWLSFVLAISFTEAWVKFKAPTLTRAAAVDAGRHVFAALNSVESGLALALAAALFLLPPRPLPDLFVAVPSPLDAWRKLVAVPLVALSLQVSWLTPSLDRRARELIVGSWKKKEEEKKGRSENDDGEDNEKGARAAVVEMEQQDKGTPVPPAWLHGVYVILEAVKVVSLALLVKAAGRGVFV